MVRITGFYLLARWMCSWWYVIRRIRLPKWISRKKTSSNHLVSLLEADTIKNLTFTRRCHKLCVFNVPDWLIISGSHYTPNDLIDLPNQVIARWARQSVHNPMTHRQSMIYYKVLLGLNTLIKRISRDDCVVKTVILIPDKKHCQAKSTLSDIDCVAIQNKRKVILKLIFTLVVFLSLACLTTWFSLSNYRLAGKFRLAHHAIKQKQTQLCFDAYHELVNDRWIAQFFLFAQFDSVLNALLSCHFDSQLDVLTNQLMTVLENGHDPLSQWQRYSIWHSICVSGKAVLVRHFSPYTPQEGSILVNKIRQTSAKKRQFCLAKPMVAKKGLSQLADDELYYTVIMDQLLTQIPQENLYTLQTKKILTDHSNQLITQATKQLEGFGKKLTPIDRQALLIYFQHHAAEHWTRTLKHQLFQQHELSSHFFYETLDRLSKVIHGRSLIAKKQWDQFYLKYEKIIKTLHQSMQHANQDLLLQRKIIINKLNNQPDAAFIRAEEDIHALLFSDEDWVEALLLLPVQSSWSALWNQYWGSVGARWQQSVSSWAEKQVNPYFPFSRHGDDLPLDILTEYLHPQHGRLSQFIQTYIEPLVPAPGSHKHSLPLNHKTYQVAKELSDLGKVLFRENRLHFDFAIYPKPHAKLSHLIWQYGHQTMKYRNDLQTWQHWHWPQVDSHISLSAHYGDKLLYHWQGAGDWSLFHLFSHAQLKRLNRHRCQLHWAPSRNTRGMRISLLIDAQECEKIIHIAKFLDKRKFVKNMVDKRSE